MTPEQTDWLSLVHQTNDLVAQVRCYRVKPTRAAESARSPAAGLQALFGIRRIDTATQKYKGTLQVYC
jgi:hypothetical protein